MKKYMLIPLLLLSGCMMEMGKITDYQPDGKTIAKVTETRKNASTMQMILTIIGMRIKMIAPAGSDMSPVELDFGLIRACESVTPMGEKSSTNTDASGILPWDNNVLHHQMSVNLDPTDTVDTGLVKGNKSEVKK